MNLIFDIKLCLVCINGDTHFHFKQTIETDAASAAESFTIDGSTYLVITNTGNIRRYVTKSRVYKINENGTLLVVSLGFQLWLLTDLLICTKSNVFHIFLKF